MINKKLIAVALAAATMGLASCGGSTTPTATSDAGKSEPVASPVDPFGSVEENSSEIKLDFDVRLTGTINSWDVASKSYQLSKVTNSEYSITVDLPAAAEFKVTFDGKWGGDLGYEPVSKGIAEDIAANFEDAGGNVGVKVAGSYKIDYFPFAVVGDNIPVKISAAKK